MQNNPLTSSPSRRPPALKTAAGLAFTAAGLFLVLLGYALLGLALLAGRPPESSTPANNFAAALVGGLGLGGALLYLAAGLGLVKRQRWAWIMALVLQAINLVMAISIINLEFNPPLPAGVSASPSWTLVIVLLVWIGLHIALLLALLAPQTRQALR